jgi:release factor glutamine methyltransferase
MEVYQPAEDSYLFAEFLKSYFGNLSDKEIRYLDMGCGSGILPEVALDMGVREVFAADINPYAVVEAEEKGAMGIISDLFSGVEGKFDVISFNAPYLPLDSREPAESRLATTGGIRGDEVAVKFLNQAREYLNEGGKIFLLVSSLTPMNEINKFKPRVVSRMKLFEEELVILEFV